MKIFHKIFENSKYVCNFVSSYKKLIKWKVKKLEKTLTSRRLEEEREYLGRQSTNFLRVMKTTTLLLQ